MRHCKQGRHQASFKSEMERAPFKCLHWNVDDAFVKIKIFITTGVLKGCDSYLFIKLC